MVLGCNVYIRRAYTPTAIIVTFLESLPSEF